MSRENFRLLREFETSLGITSKHWFIGFKLHVLAAAEKKICQVVLTPGNYADRAAVEALTEFLEFKSVIGDLGYRAAKNSRYYADGVFTAIKDSSRQEYVIQENVRFPKLPLLSATI